MHVYGGVTQRGELPQSNTPMCLWIWGTCDNFLKRVFLYPAAAQPTREWQLLRMLHRPSHTLSVTTQLLLTHVPVTEKTHL